MDIFGIIKSTPLADLIIVGLLAGAFILGIMQGAVRVLASIVAIFVAFLVAANLRDPVGRFLADNWTQFPAAYNHMLAFLLIFLILSVIAVGVIILRVRRTPLYPQRPVVDDILGGVLGLLEGFLILLFLIIILGSFKMPEPFQGEIGPIRDLHNVLIDQSHIAGALKSGVAPGFVHLLSAMLPSDLVAMFP